MDFLEGDRARLEPSGPSKRPPSPEEWYVTSQGDFWPSSHRERPGVQLPFRGEFDWAGFHWLVPGVYSTAKALVVDFCRQVEPEDVRAFVEKWRLTPENDREELFTKEERRRMAAENPLEFSFHPAAVVNGREYPYKRGSGSYYNCCVNWNSQEPEGKLLGEHYGLNPEKVWSLWRFAFPWGRRKRVKSLSLRLKAEPIPLPGSVFQVRGPGDRVELAHPKTGKKSILTVKSLQAIHHRELPRTEGWEFPGHLWELVYTLEPEQEGFSLQDTVDNDPLRPNPLPGNGTGVGPTAAFAAVHSHAASIGIIGGADGPVSLYVREEALPLCHTAFSSLHFQPVEQVTWLPVFQERPWPDQLVPLEKKE